MDSGRIGRKRKLENRQRRRVRVRDACRRKSQPIRESASRERLGETVTFLNGHIISQSFKKANLGVFSKARRLHNIETRQDGRGSKVVAREDKVCALRLVRGGEAVGCRDPLLPSLEELVQMIIDRGGGELDDFLRQVQTHAKDLELEEDIIGNRFRVKAALDWFEKEVPHKIDRCGVSSRIVRQTVFSILDCEWCGLALSLLRILSASAVEVYREKAACILLSIIGHESLRRANGCSSEGDSSRAKAEDEKRWMGILCSLYISFSHVFYHRLYRPTSIGVAKIKSHSRDAAVERATEPVEEIRLLLVQLLNRLVQVMLFHVLHFQTPPREKGDHGVGHSDEVRQAWVWTTPFALPQRPPKERKQLVEATSRYCQSLPSRLALLDGYPDLKRECCVAIEAICQLHPNVVRMNAEALLRPLTLGEREGTGGGGTDIPKPGAPLTSTLSLQTTSSSLLRHRHAKTRSLAIRASASVVQCTFRNAQEVLDDNTGVETEGVQETKVFLSRGPQDDKVEQGICGDKDVPTRLLIDLAIPSWEECCCGDRVASVRQTLIQEVSDLMIMMLKSSDLTADSSSVDRDTVSPVALQSPTYARLLVLLAGGVADDSEEIRNVANAKMERVASIAFRTGSDQLSTVDENFVGRMMRRNARMFIPLLTSGANHWSPTHRSRFLKILTSVLGLIASPGSERGDGTEEGDTLPFETGEVLDVLLERTLDDVASVRADAAICAEVLGQTNWMAYSNLDSLLRIMRQIGVAGREEATAETNKQIQSLKPMKSGLFVLSAMIRGASQSAHCSSEGNRWIDLRIQPICEVISSHHLMSLHGDRGTMWAAYGVCKALVETKPAAFVGSRTAWCLDKAQGGDIDNGRKSTVEETGVGGEDYEASKSRPKGTSCVLHFLRCCVQMLGCPEDFRLRAPVNDMLSHAEEYMIEADKPQPCHFECHFRDLVHKLESESSGPEERDTSAAIPPWKEGEAQLLAFDALLRNSTGETTGNAFDVVSVILERHLSDTCTTNFAVKLFMMSLLEAVISDRSCPRGLIQPFTAHLLGSVIVPNLVWQVGASASAVRKIATASLFSLLRGCGITPRSLFLCAPRLLPTLKSNLGDHDASMRQLTCASLDMIFGLLPGALGEEPVYQLYPALIGCLDDCNDEVRLTAGNSLKSFLQSAPVQHLKGTSTHTFAIDQLLIHMDDPNPQVQRCCFDVLRVAVSIDAPLVAKKARSAMSCHRKGTYCQMLLSESELLHPELSNC